MAKIYLVDFKRGRMSLDEAREFLGEYFDIAMSWDREELERTMNASLCVLSGADEAYEAVYRYRFGSPNDRGQNCQVIQFSRRDRKAS
jgi:hypothetical protein